MNIYIQQAQIKQAEDCILLVRVTALSLPYLLIKHKATILHEAERDKIIIMAFLTPVNFTQVIFDVYETGIIKETNA